MTAPLPPNHENEGTAPWPPPELESLREHFAPIHFHSANTSGMERLSTVEPTIDRRSPLPLDNSLVQQTKDQIRGHVETIKRLATTAVEPQEFLAVALSQIIQAMGAKAAAVWERRPTNNWELISQRDLPASLLAGSDRSAHSFSTWSDASGVVKSPESSFEQLDLLQSKIASLDSDECQGDCGESASQLHPSPAHLLILNAVAKEKQPILIPPSHASIQPDRPANPTTDLLIFAPFPMAKEIGTLWLQVIQPASGGLSSQRGYLRFAAQMAEVLAEYYRTHRLRLFERDRVCLKVAQQVMSDMTLQSQQRTGLARLANTLREHARSEHAILMRKPSRYGRWRVEAAAGLVEIDRRAEGIVQIERVAIWLDSNLEANTKASMESLVVDVAQRDQDVAVWTNMFAVTGMAWLKPLVDPSQSKPKTRVQDVAIVLTWSHLNKPPAECIEQCNLIARLGLSALKVTWWQQAIAQLQQNPSWKTRWLYPTLWSRAFQLSVCAVVMIFIALLPVPIRLHATAVLMPTVQQHVYAPLDCVVEEVLVRHGEHVRLGQPLLRLGANHLAAEYEQTMAQHLRNQQRLKDIESRLLREKSLSPQHRDELEGEREAIEGTQRIELRMLEGLKQQLDSLLIVAHIDGIVSTWNIRENLNERPLRTGQWLLSLHDARSDWVIEAALPEEDGNDFFVAMRTQNDSPWAILQSSPQTQLKLKYRNEPSRIDRVGRLGREQEFQQRMGPADSVIRMRFDVVTEDLPMEGTVAGATARVSINQGRGPLFWALSRDFIRRTWTQIKMWI
jgi:multidrug efflux pump subunit AcrA (membrane-fusion protein)